MNGLLHTQTLGTPLEGKWGTFGGPRAYTKYVQAEPTATQPAPAANKPTDESSGKASLKAPQRGPNAIRGAEFAKNIAAVPLKDREAAILQEITSGNLPVGSAPLLRSKSAAASHQLRTPPK